MREADLLQGDIADVYRKESTEMRAMIFQILRKHYPSNEAWLDVPDRGKAIIIVREAYTQGFQRAAELIFQSMQ